MTLIKSISGIRGTIGGPVGQGLTPPDVVKYAAAYGTWVKTQATDSKLIIIGRDARISGEMVSRLVAATLQGLGLDVCDLGLSTTPTVEMAVPAKKAAGRGHHPHRLAQPQAVECPQAAQRDGGIHFRSRRAAGAGLGRKREF